MINESLILAENFSVKVSFHMRNHKIAMVSLSRYNNKSKTRDCERNLSLMTMKSNQMVYNIILMFCHSSSISLTLVKAQKIIKVLINTPVISSFQSIQFEYP